jgi:hypothetical protein
MTYVKLDTDEAPINALCRISARNQRRDRDKPGGWQKTAISGSLASTGFVMASGALSHRAWSS